VRPARFARVAVVIKPSTLLSFHRALGHAGHGPIHPTHRWIRRSQRRT
jgi:hypothetical protein